jgi:phosphatidate cytidylyltransferase
VVKSGDSGAYFTGKLLGRRKLCRVSPNKTMEGAAGGLAVSVGTAVLGAFFLLPEGFCTLPAVMIVAVCVSAAAQAGDLVESLVKRSCRVKDSSPVIPELGGILDVIDSIIFAAPVLYFFVAMSG